jgi:tetratricopeptide (TPR) repeat protein
MDPQRGRDLKFDVAMMALNHLDRESEAISHLEALLSDDPGDARVVEALQVAYQKSERYEDLSRLIAEQLEHTTDPETVAMLKVGLAHLRRERFNDHPGAIALLEEVFVISPDNQQASAALAQLYEETEQFSDLIGLLSRRKLRAQERGDAEAQLSHLREMAKIAEVRVKDEVLAVDCWLEIRTLDDSPETREELLRLMLAAGQLKEAAALLEEICAALSDAQALRRRRELCELYRLMNDTPALIRTIEGSLALAPDDEDLKMLLRTEYEHEGQWDKVAQLVLTEAESAAALKDKLALYREAADIQWKHCEDPGAAAAILERAAEAAPGDREILLLLCDAYSACGRGIEAAGVLEKVVESFGGKRSKELGDIHRRLATAYLSNQQQDKALEELEKAFRIEPGNILVLTQLGDVALAAGDMKKAQQMFRALLLQRLDESSPISKAQVFLRLGQIHERLGEGPKARQMYERAVQTDPNFDEAKRALQTL